MNNFSWFSKLLILILSVFMLGISRQAVAQQGSPDTAAIDSAQQEAAKPFFVVDSIREVENELLVKYKETVSTQEVTTIVSRFGAEVIETIPKLNILRCRLTRNRNMQQAIQTFDADPNILYAEPNYVLYALETPNDPDFNKLWGLNNEGQTGGTFDADIDAPEAWDKQKGSRDVILSIIDTGVDYNHPDLKNNMWTNQDEIPGNNIDDDHNGFVDDVRGWDFINNDNNPMDDNDHGTHCAGIAGAVGNNGRGVVGVNWQVSIMPLKFLGSGGSGSTSDAIKAIIYAVDNGAKVLSNSWGGGGESQALKDAIIYADTSGVLFVAAAGNESNNTDVTPNYPSAYDVQNIMAIAATDDRDNLAQFSNYGVETVDFAAPGVDILSSAIDNRYIYLSGTSMATPYAAGSAALVWAQYLPQSNKDIVKYRIFGGVDYIRGLDGYILLAGRLNVNNALSTNPLISVIENPADTNDDQGPYPVVASIVDDDSISDAKIYYRVSNGNALEDTLLLEPLGDYLYNADIPGASQGSTIEFKILATDNQGNFSGSRFYSFKIGQSGSGCCGSAAASFESNDVTGNVIANVGINFLLFLGIPVYMKMWFRRKRD